MYVCLTIHVFFEYSLMKFDLSNLIIPFKYCNVSVFVMYSCVRKNFHAQYNSYTMNIKNVK